MRVDDGLVTIRLSFVYPPIPSRSQDWCAYLDDEICCEECHLTRGWGSTRWEALHDLLDQLEERQEVSDGNVSKPA